MAKSPQNESPGKGDKKAIVKVGAAGLPADLADRFEQDAGKGTSQDAKDNLVPMIAILQDKSPQVDKMDPKFIDGCESGMIWLKGVPDPFVAGEEGIVVQPCFFFKNFVEWMPRDKGGGFVGIWATPPKEAKEVVDPKNRNKVKWVMPSGSEIIEARYHVVRVFREDGGRPQFVIPFSSTGHTVSRGWMNLMNSFPLKSGKPAPSYARLYRLRLKYNKKPAGSWWSFDPTDEGWITDVNEYEQGLALNAAFERQEKTADMAGMSDAGVGEPGESDQTGAM